MRRFYMSIQDNMMSKYEGIYTGSENWYDLAKYND